MPAPAPREERYRAFVESCSEAFFCVDFAEPIPTGLPAERQIELAYQHGFLSDANRAMAQMYGYGEASEILGSRLERLMPKEPVILDYLTSFIASGYRANELESKEQDRNGDTKYFVNNLIGICEGDRLLRVWGTQRDVTDRKQLEDQLRKSHRMEAIGRLAGGVAHDFNDVLSVILTVSSLLDVDPAQEWKEDVAMIREAALRGAELTKQLLAVGQSHIIRVKTIDLGALIHSMERMLRRLAGDRIEISIDVAPDLWPMRGDSGSLEQLILNLVVNACDSMSMSGRLTIAARNVEVPTGHQVMLSVSDTGVGNGTEDLGLDLLHGMVRQSRGTVEVDRSAGNNTFKIYFPRVKDSA